MTQEAKRGGLLVRAGEGLRFLPSSVVLRVVAVPPVTAIPGTVPELAGVALHEGVVVPVIVVGARRDVGRAPRAGYQPPHDVHDVMVVCHLAGELVGLVGLEVVATGEFQPDGDGVRTATGEHALPFDFAGIFARVEQHPTRGRRARGGGVTGP
jgi:chemotaxis signal transduction protein